MQLGFTCDSQLVFAFAPNCMLLKVHTLNKGVNFSPYLNLIFVLVFFFLDYPCQISRFLDFLGSHNLLLKLFSMVGLWNEQYKKLISACTSAWDLGTILSKVTLCVRCHERNGDISWSRIGHKKYNVSKFVLNQKQECKWALEVVH